MNWAISRTVSTHNQHVYFKKDDCAAGVAFSYYRTYVLLQQQASIFFIPLNIVGLNTLKEDDLLSQTIIEEASVGKIKGIPGRYKETVMKYIQDQVPVLKEELLSSKELLKQEITSTKKISKSSFSYYEGEIQGYTEILNYIREQAIVYGISLASLHIDDID
jgi:hypothetical protein